MIRNLLLLSLLIFGFHEAAMGQEISGTVSDVRTGEPLAFANVFTPSGNATITDEKGVFQLTVEQGDSIFTVSFIGYQSQIIQIDPAQKSYSVRLEKSETVIDEVVLSAGKFEQRIQDVTVSMEVLKPDLIDNKNAQADIQNAIEQTPGVQVIDGQANIRGGSGWSYGAGSRVLVTVDGMPLISGDAGQVQWDILPVEHIEQIEVIKGASSVLYGSSALNGVIHLKTKSPGIEPETQVTAFSGFHSAPSRPELQWWDSPRWYSGLNVHHMRKQGRNDWIIGGQLFNDEGYQLGVEERRARLTAGWQRRSEVVDGLSYRLDVNMMANESGDALIWESDSNAYIPLDSSATVTSGIDFYIDPRIMYRRDRWRSELKNRFLRINNNAASDTNSYDNFSSLYFSEWQNQFFIDENWTLTAGLLFQFIRSDSELFGGLHRSTNTAGYVQGDFEKDRWNISAGVRYEYFKLDEVTDNRPVFRGGVNYRLASATNLRASFGQGYRFPTMAEKFTSTNVGAVFVYPNEDIRPETGWSSEVGVKQGFKFGEFTGFVDASYFLTRYDEMMEFTFARWNNSTSFDSLLGLGFKSVNIGEIQISGFEFSTAFRGEVGKWKLSGLLGYNYINPKALNPDRVYAVAEELLLDDYDNELTYANTGTDTTGVLKYRYRHLAKMDLQIERGVFFVGGSIRYNSYMENIDRVFQSELFSAFVPGVEDSRARNLNGDLLFDIRCGFSFLEKYRLALLVQNVTNREFVVRPAQLGPPRNISIQLKAVF